jgi:hypothetical protein
MVAALLKETQTKTTTLPQYLERRCKLYTGVRRRKLGSHFHDEKRDHEEVLNDL